MEPRNVELQTESLACKADAISLNLGGQVPAGMKRWVTFITVDAAQPANVVGARVYFASVNVSNPTEASSIAVANRKMLVDLRASKAVDSVRGGCPFQVPRQPNVDKPLFSISGGNWLGILASDVSANVFVQYFDE